MTTSTRWLTILLLAAATVPGPARAGDERDDGARPFRTPPQEAQAACAQRELGAACSFTLDGRPRTGVCRRGPQGEGPIACDPHGARESGREPEKRAPEPKR